MTKIPRWTRSVSVSLPLTGSYYMTTHYFHVVEHDGARNPGAGHRCQGVANQRLGDSRNSMAVLSTIDG